MPPPALFDLSKADFDNPEFDLLDIRRVNPQRHEMEQLTAILYVDRENNLIVVSRWISGGAIPEFIEKVLAAKK